MKKSIAIIIFLLIACVNQQQQNPPYKKWIGQSVHNLYQDWGTPEDIFHITHKRKIISFVKYDMIEGSREEARYCRISFDIQNEKIINYTFSGTSLYCLSLK